jgi:hypothetical protein
MAERPGSHAAAWIRHRYSENAADAERRARLVRQVLTRRFPEQGGAAVVRAAPTAKAHMADT